MFFLIGKHLNERIRYLGDTSNFAPSPAGEGWDEGD
ncbi:MAG: hypothetical protein RIR39_665 [Pseudomonadota bacterium]|jgi:hypothetical protein